MKNTQNFKRGIKVYNKSSRPSLLYGSENWIIKARDARIIAAVEIKYVEKQQDRLGQSIKNAGIAKELNVTPVLDKTQN